MHGVSSTGIRMHEETNDVVYNVVCYLRKNKLYKLSFILYPTMDFLTQDLKHIRQSAQFSFGPAFCSWGRVW